MRVACSPQQLPLIVHLIKKLFQNKARGVGFVSHIIYVYSTPVFISHPPFLLLFMRKSSIIAKI